ncbi:MAG: hypothetical protein LQ345_006839, partial [Seirophora villosa]
DCLTLIAGLDALALMPGTSGPKRWGRNLPPSPSTEHIPRYYWIEDDRPEIPPPTCAVVVDMGPDTWAVDTFGLWEVAGAAREVYGMCLLGRGQVGLEFPGEDGHAFVRLARLDGRPPGGVGLGLGLGRRVKLEGGAGWLRIVDGEVSATS